MYRYLKSKIGMILPAAGIVMMMSFTLLPGNKAPLHVIAVKTPEELKTFFHYTGDRIPFVSSHRGGPSIGYPENCIATFENTLRHTWSIIELDPHYSKDSVLVVMHDPTLDRTSNGHGRIADHTLAQLRRLQLKDVKGNLTPYGISTLDEMLEWAKGKTILVLDAKEVPIEARVKKIQEHRAQPYAMVIAYSLEDARKCYDMDKNILMEVMMPDAAAVKRFDSTGIPWSNVVPFVTHTRPEDPGIFQLIHEKGAMCIMGSSRTIDRDYTAGKITAAGLDSGYQRMVAAGADIIEADLGIEAGTALQQMQDVHSSKHRFFTMEK